jgi:CRP-like cAMP-binding protein
MGAAHRAHRDIFESPIFRNVDLRQEERDVLEAVGFIAKTYTAGDEITREGDHDDRTFILDSGWGCLYKILPDGERQILDFPLTGDVIGLHGHRASAQRSFMAITDVVVHEAGATALISAIARSERLAQFFIAEESRYKGILIEHLTNLGRRSALSRTAHLLLELGARLALTKNAAANGYKCPLTQYDLADALGLTAIHVNRMLRELRQSDLLSFQRGFVEFIDIERLRTLSGFDEAYIAHFGLYKRRRM